MSEQWRPVWTGNDLGLVSALILFVLFALLSAGKPITPLHAPHPIHGCADYGQPGCGI